jgi:hypothetical protein
MSSSIDNFDCNECGIPFSSKKELEMHLKQEHSKDRNI